MDFDKLRQRRYVGSVGQNDTYSGERNEVFPDSYRDSNLNTKKSFFSAFDKLRLQRYVGKVRKSDTLSGEFIEVLILNTLILIRQKTTLRTLRKSSRSLRLSIQQALEPIEYNVLRSFSQCAPCLPSTRSRTSFLSAQKTLNLTEFCAIGYR